MSTLREKMKQEMILVGLAASTQEIYLKAVLSLNDYYKNRRRNCRNQKLRIICFI